MTAGRLHRAPLVRVLAMAAPEAPRMALGVLAGTAALGSAVALLATSAWLIARAAQHPDVSALSVAVVAVRTFGIGRGLFRYLERLVSHDAAFRVLADVRVTVYERLERLAPGGLPAFRRGDLLARLVGDVDVLQDLFLRVVGPYAAAALVGAGSVTLAALLLPSAALVLVAALVLAAVVAPLVTVRLARRAERAVAGLRGELSVGVVDLLDGAPELLAYGVADDALAAVSRTDARLTAALRRSAATTALGAALGALASGAAVWGALRVGVPAVRVGRMDGVQLAVLTLLPLAVFEAFVGLPAAAQQLGRVRAAAVRVLAVLDAPEPVHEPLAPAPAPAPPYLVRLEGVSARWPAQEGRPSALALDHVDLELAPGRRVALVGESGAGKSTVLAVLLRFLDVESGRVTISGVDAARLSGDLVRTVVGAVTQDAHVFDSTVAENVRLARPGSSDDAVRAALARAGLAGELPDGLATRVGEHGGRLSGGQRQRLALARALLADVPVLLLDEPGEHLEAATADRLTADVLAAAAAVGDASGARAVLLVTHRLAGLDAVDEVVVLDHGRVTARGSHAHLLATSADYRARWESERATDALVAAA